MHLLIFWVSLMRDWLLSLKFLKYLFVFILLWWFGLPLQCGKKCDNTSHSCLFHDLKKNISKLILFWMMFALEVYRSSLSSWKHSILTLPKVLSWMVIEFYWISFCYHGYNYVVCLLSLSNVVNYNSSDLKFSYFILLLAKFYIEAV